ncbi:bifunctional molybdenum cofactor biosynthesis protein MoaC/MoaB [uncultured Flavobacterium sp.]|uniref:bifunctional molybdenum cofactor biosynthesis protein MoaC/MoaB n=1 Tax=uncultured Flavobacterium sp. TaxID=165435 RepID=UPI0025EEAD05|nr:bifunctional molybdenum cofactor biosynthesis protein MoaC/MoaB [uncultured Flavobacterium sp.]
MVDITHKSFTLRKAVAKAVVKTSKQETIDAIKQRKVPKGDIFEFARVAGLFALKKTSDVIPDCHPLPIEFATITYEIENLSIIICVEVHTIYKTGVEVEAMHGASVVALVMYDMLKPIDKNVQIENIHLHEKKGGKSDFKNNYSHLKTAVIVCSDSVSNGKKEDTAGKSIINLLEKHQIECAKYEIVPDDFEMIQQTAKSLSGTFDLVLFTGGTGLSKRDVTPDAIEPLLEKQIPGIIETARNYGQQRIRTSMLSRGVAGFIKETLVLTFPGSQKACEEYMEAIFPQVLHVFDVKNGGGH